MRSRERVNAVSKQEGLSLPVPVAGSLLCLIWSMEAEPTLVRSPSTVECRILCSIYRSQRGTSLMDIAAYRTCYVRHKTPSMQNRGIG